MNATLFRPATNAGTMKGVLIAILIASSAFAPLSLAYETSNDFDVTYFDRNANGLDDRMEPILRNGETVGIILMLDKRPTEEHFSAIKKLDLDINHVYKYIDAIRINHVSPEKIMKLTEMPNLKLIEWQAPVYPSLNKSVSAIKARDSSEYSPVAWDKGFYGEGINIAILDTGVDNEHETFGIYGEQGVRRFIAGIDCDGGCPRDSNQKYLFTTEEDSNGDPNDVNGHGTHTASTALGMGGDDDEDGDGEPDYIGVAPAARLIDVKVMADWGSGSVADINEAIEACIENVNTDWENDGEKNNGVHVMSLSLGTSGGSDGSDSQSQLINQANAVGIVSAIAMGNDGEQEVPSPAAADWSVAVGAIDDMDSINRNDDELASYSNYGPRDDDDDADRWDELKPSVVAPGSSIDAALCGGCTSNPFGSAQGWTSQSGTSMACPHVAGLAALILEADITLRPRFEDTNGNGTWDPDEGEKAYNEVRDRLQDFSETWEDSEHNGNPSEPNESEKYNYYFGYGYLDSYEIIDINRPDAFVSEISITPEEPLEGDTVTVSAKVENVGSLRIDTASIKLLLNEVLEEKDTTSLTQIEQGSSEIWTYQWLPDEGEYEIMVEVFDVSPSEGELNNNLLEKTLSVGAAPANGVDLTITDVWTDDDNPVHNENIAIYTKIKNQGNEKVEDFELRLYDDDDRFTTLEGAEVEVEQEITIFGEWIAEEGESKISARLVSIQPQDQNPNNDDREFYIDVGAPPEEPDFIPAKLEVEGALEEGNDVVIKYEIRNLGKTKGKIDYELKIDNQLEQSGTTEVDGQLSEEKTFSWSATEGEHTISINLKNADPAEISTDNNMVETTIDVEEATAKFEIVEIFWTDPIYANEQTNIKVSLKNYGGATGSVDTMLYADEIMIGSENTEIEAGNNEEVYFIWVPEDRGENYNVYISAKTNYDDKERGTTIYVQKIEEKNEKPVVKSIVMVNGEEIINPMIITATEGDTITFSAEGSYDTDGTIRNYEWVILRSSDNYEIKDSRVSFSHSFTKGGTYSITLTVTDDKGDNSAWQGSMIITQNTATIKNKEVSDSNRNNLIGGSIALIGLLVGASALRYFRGEEEDDFFDFEDTGPLSLACPNCSGIITLTTDQRPIQIGCPHCQSQFMIRE